MNHELICVIPTLAEIIRKWDDEIEHSEDKSNWLVWKKSYIERFQQGDIIPYYGMLHGVTICEATAQSMPERFKMRRVWLEMTWLIYLLSEPFQPVRERDIFRFCSGICSMT